MCVCCELHRKLCDRLAQLQILIVPPASIFTQPHKHTTTHTHTHTNTNHNYTYTHTHAHMHTHTCTHTHTYAHTHTQPLKHKDTHTNTPHSTHHTAHITQHTSHITQHTSHSTQHTAHSTHLCAGFLWTNCELTLCPNRCSGHGTCESLSDLVSSPPLPHSHSLPLTHPRARSFGGYFGCSELRGSCVCECVCVCVEVQLF